MSSTIQNLATKVASEPEKFVKAAAALASAAPVLVPVAVVGAASYGIYKLIFSLKKAENR